MLNFRWNFMSIIHRVQRPFSLQKHSATLRTCSPFDQKRPTGAQAVATSSASFSAFCKFYNLQGEPVSACRGQNRPHSCIGERAPGFTPRRKSSQSPRQLNHSWKIAPRVSCLCGKPPPCRFCTRMLSTFDFCLWQRRCGCAQCGAAGRFRLHDMKFYRHTRYKAPALAGVLETPCSATPSVAENAP